MFHPQRQAQEKIMKTTTIQLNEAEHEALTKIAENAGCFLRNGKPSWRKMILDMAGGTFVLYDKRKPKKKKEWKTKGKAESIPGAPSWWKPFYGNAMGLDYALKSSGLTLDEIHALGLRSEHNPLLKHPDVIVGKPEWEVAKFLPSVPHWWWRPSNNGNMMADDVAETSGLTVEAMVSGGFILDAEVGILTAPPAWKAWMSKDNRP